ncbi:MAG: DUF5117 domain-containing protein [Ignavibacteriota bacterium]
MPDGNYTPRYDDPRAGYGGTEYVDYSTPIGEPMVKRFLHRHRLEKKDPQAEMGEAVKPIQYWVDSGAPEDVKKALVEGASWWNQAFEGRGLPQWLPGCGAARWRGPDGYSLQHDQPGCTVRPAAGAPAAR